MPKPPRVVTYGDEFLKAILVVLEDMKDLLGDCKELLGEIKSVLEQ